MGKTVLTPFTIYAEPDVLDRLKRAAKEDGRSLSNWLVHTGSEKAEEMGVPRVAKSGSARSRTSVIPAARRA
jgi:hypothetical protein